MCECTVVEKTERKIKVSGKDYKFSARVYSGSPGSSTVSVVVAPNLDGDSFTLRLCSQNFSISIRDIDALIKLLGCVKESAK